MSASVALTQLGKNIRSWRERRGLSFTGVAAACGLTASEVEALERGEFEIRLDDLQVMSDLLGVRIADLFAQDDQDLAASAVEIRAV